MDHVLDFFTQGDVCVTLLVLGLLLLIGAKVAEHRRPGRSGGARTHGLIACCCITCTPLTSASASPASSSTCTSIASSATASPRKSSKTGRGGCKPSCRHTPSA